MTKSRMPRSNDAEIPEEGMEADKELYTISNLINMNKKKKKHSIPILLENANGILSKSKYLTLRILLDSSVSY